MTCDSKIQMRFSLLSNKCSAAPPSFRLCCPNRDQRFDLITSRSAVVGSREESPTHLRRIFPLIFEIYQTPRRELKIRRAVAEYFSIFDEIRGVWIDDETLSQVFDMSSQSKQKLRRKRRSKIVKIYAN